MKKTIERAASVLKGVSTLDTMMKKTRIILLLVLSMTALGGAVRGGHSTLDIVDPSFSPQIQTEELGCKNVSQIIPLPDGKTLIAGAFNSYNRQPVDRLARLNADGTLDTTFITNLPSGWIKVGLQADGKILVRLEDWNNDIYQLIRLNADGTLDPTFNYDSSIIWLIAFDANGRIILGGLFNENRSIVRLNSDGSPDPTFVSPLNFPYVRALETQNNKIIISSQEGGIQRLNEDGTIDSSFITREFWASNIIVQPDRKILLLGESNLRRLNENGSDDTGFTTTTFSFPPHVSGAMALSGDGKITLATRTGNGRDYRIRRLFTNGTADSSFTPYFAVRFNTMAMQANGGVLIGDGDVGCSIHPLANDFVRLFPNGSPDPAFDTGIGFQTLGAGSVAAINVQPDGKILIGGTFELVNDVPRSKIARINADSTLDTSFQINTSGTGNYFGLIVQVGNIRMQSDGKIVLTGFFEYVVNGVTKKNLVRLNSDGSIDPTFILGVSIQHPGVTFRSGTNKFVTFSDGKLLVGTSRYSLEQPAVPVKLTATGQHDTSFIPGVYQQQTAVYIQDVAVQPDGKIIIAGDYETSGITKSFLTRLNADGSLDTTFQSREQFDKAVRAFVLLPNGKIVLSETNSTWSQSGVLRLNADGSLDPTFNAGTGANGRINTMLLLSTGRIFVGGKFTTFNGQPRANLVQINADGSVFTPVYNLNDEVLSLAADSTGRVFVGGNFTIINTGGCGAARSYVAALIDAPSSNTRFDFDGDGCADISVFRPSDRTWYLNQSANGFSATQFGLSTDKITPADYDGDGRTDISVYRDGVWYWLKSSDNSFNAVQFGIASDLPVPADFTGDGRSELAVYRSGTWWTLNLTNNQANAIQFGRSSDKPVVEDYDGDGRADQAVYRGSGEWHLNRSSQGYTVIQFGLPNDKTVPADYDGDGKADLAVYRDGTWYVLQSTNGFTAFQWGISTDVPAPADYDGDGRADAAVFRDGAWWIRQSTNGIAIQQFGLAGDKPVAAAFLP